MGQLLSPHSTFSWGLSSYELLTLLFAIYVLEVRNALIVIDEPELHLHPRWQTTLLNLFEKLATETGNQFLLATHSPTFVSPSSIQYVSRIYSENQRSAIVSLKNEQLPNIKHLSSLVNSQNNERIFFADKVVLVEGISDRLFFEAVFKHLTQNSTQIFEFVSVGGKTLFSAYEKILQALCIPYAIIADLDYLKEIGSHDIKQLFSVNPTKFKKNVIDDPTSRDGQSLLDELESAIATGGNLDPLKKLFEHIKSRQSRLNNGLSKTEQQTVDEFIQTQTNNNIFILSKGSLESYLPKEHKSKDLEKLIDLVSYPDRFWNALDETIKPELIEISTKIEKMQKNQIQQQN